MPLELVRGLGDVSSAGAARRRADLSPHDKTVGETEPMLIDDYCAHLLYRGRSKATVKRRRVTLSQLERWIAPVALADVTLDMLEAFASQWTAPATRRAYVSDVRDFYRWAVKRGRVLVNPADDLDPISVPTPEANPVPAAGVAVLLAAPAPAATLRMVGMAAFAGFRVSEIAAACGRHVDRRGGAIVIPLSKMGHGRTVPLVPELAELLAGAPDGRLFPDLSPRGVSERMQRLMNRCGLGAWHPHNLRASFATEASTRVDPWTLQRLLGHSSIATTQRYVRPRRADVEQLTGLYLRAA